MARSRNEWLSTTEVAELKNVTPNAVRMAIKQGRIRGEHFADVYRVSRRDAEAWQISSRGRPGGKRGTKG